MISKTNVVSIAAILGLYFLNLTWATCNVCQVNGAACTSPTTFNLCFGETTPFEDQTFTCNDGLVCTDLPNICFQKSTRPASCGDTSSCGKCNSNQVFACTSRTTFSFCYGSIVPSDVNGTCPNGKTCDAASQNICVSATTTSSIVCERDAATL